VVTIKEDGVRAKAAGGAQRHRRVDAVFAGFVAGRGDDAALIGAAAYYDGLAAQFGTCEEFDGNEEGVHVHMENGRVERDFGGVLGRSVVFGAEASQIRHGSRVRREPRGWQ